MYLPLPKASRIAAVVGVKAEAAITVAVVAAGAAELGGEGVALQAQAGHLGLEGGGGLGGGLPVGRLGLAHGWLRRRWSAWS